MKKVIFHLPIIVLIAFGLLSLFLTSSVIFDQFGIREKEGNYVLFIVQANLIASILYLLASYFWIKLEFTASKLLGTATTLLIIAQIALFTHINIGGIYEEKTVKAMFFRIGLTLFLTILSYFIIKKERKI